MQNYCFFVVNTDFWGDFSANYNLISSICQTGIAEINEDYVHISPKGKKTNQITTYYYSHIEQLNIRLIFISRVGNLGLKDSLNLFLKRIRFEDIHILGYLVIVNAIDIGEGEMTISRFPYFDHVKGEIEVIRKNDPDTKLTIGLLNHNLRTAYTSDQILELLSLNQSIDIVTLDPMNIKSSKMFITNSLQKISGIGEVEQLIYNINEDMKPKHMNYNERYSQYLSKLGKK